MRELYRPGARCRVHHCGTVHAVDLDDDNRPLPLCRVGVSGWSPGRALTATVEPITCGRCLRLTGAGARPARPRAPIPGQTTLELWPRPVPADT